MALIKCHECKKDVSTEAKSCPNCGAKVRVPGHIGGAGTFLLVIIGAVWLFSSLGNSGTSSQTPVTPTDPIKEARFQATVAATQSVKNQLRNPSSVVWEDILANDDASVICLNYRAQNGFGGMGKEFVVIAKGKASQSGSAWNKNCANKTLNDMIYVKHALN